MYTLRRFRWFYLGWKLVPSAAVKHLTDEQAFLVCNLPASALVDKEFIKAFVKKGEHIIYIAIFFTTDSF